MSVASFRKTTVAAMVLAMSPMRSRERMMKSRLTLREGVFSLSGDTSRASALRWALSSFLSRRRISRAASASCVSRHRADVHVFQQAAADGVDAGADGVQGRVIVGEDVVAGRCHEVNGLEVGLFS